MQERKPKILFVHKNYPAQFGKLAHWLGRHGWEVAFATQKKGVKSTDLEVYEFQDHRAASPGIHHYVVNYERAIISAQSFARLAVSLRNGGYFPDVVVAHCGWGVGSFAKDVWPSCKYVSYAEWYYKYPIIDRTPHDPPRDELEARAQARSRNAPIWLDIFAADRVIVPTEFQASQFPEILRAKITVLPDGIDTSLHRPGPKSTELLSSLGIPEHARVVSYVARGMEPMRGFPEFMSAAYEVQKQRPETHFIIVGEDRVAYGSKKMVPSWKCKMLESFPYDRSRLHFTGLIPRDAFVDVLRTTDAHVYLTAPFVLSWSFLPSRSITLGM